TTIFLHVHSLSLPLLFFFYHHILSSQYPIHIPYTTLFRSNPVVKTNPVNPSRSHADSPVARSEKANAQPGNFFPPNKKTEWLLFVRLVNRPIVMMTMK